MLISTTGTDIAQLKLIISYISFSTIVGVGLLFLAIFNGRNGEYLSCLNDQYRIWLVPKYREAVHSLLTMTNASAQGALALRRNRSDVFYFASVNSWASFGRQVWDLISLASDSKYDSWADRYRSANCTKLCLLPSYRKAGRGLGASGADFGFFLVSLTWPLKLFTSRLPHSHQCKMLVTNAMTTF